MEKTLADFNELGNGSLPGLLGIEILSVNDEGLRSRLAVRPNLLAPNGFLHAASVIALADTSCGYGTRYNMPDGATGFTTIELKSNFLGTVREGAILCEIVPRHLGRSTHVWDATVTDADTGRTISLFRCTQMILWPRL